MTVHRFGEPSRFAIELQKRDAGTNPAWRVDIWLADWWLTCDDNTEHVGFIAGMLQRELGKLLTDPHRPPAYSIGKGRPYADQSAEENHRRLLREAYDGDSVYHNTFRFLNWGPITDNVCAYLFREDRQAVMSFSFVRVAHHDPTDLGTVIVVEMPEWELARVLHDAAWTMMWDWCDRSQ